MPEIGQTISHYQIIEKLGQGGMGEVFLAHDTSLDRNIALKFLPEIFSDDPERLARFEREAKLLASLNHPNIATIYGLEQAEGKRFLAMELVEGETLAQQIERGPMPLDETREICSQMVEGLDAAHERGIIHRDLKPANVKITPEGKVKILDFGLAKAFQEQPAATDLSHSPTITGAMTRVGVILGTAAYMAPEQARGAAVDKRADIWAFGAVLFEMLTGRACFEGESITDVLAAVMRADPGWARLPAATPPRVRELIERCLVKDPRKRLRDIGDARLELDRAPASGDTAATSPEARSSSLLRAAALALCVVAGVALGSTAVWLTRPAPDVPDVVRSAIPLSPAWPLALEPDLSQTMAISPDGRRLVYVTRQGLSTALVGRDMETGTAEVLDGSVGGSRPFFSPKGDFVGFLSADGLLKKIPAGGGTAMTIGPANDARSFSWGDDDWIVLSATSASGLSRIRATGGVLEPLTTPDRAAREKTHRFPDVLPGARAVVFTVGFADLVTYSDARLVVRDLKSGETRTLVEGGTCGRYVAPGFLVYAKAGSLWAQAFDPGSLRTSGAPARVQADVSTSPTSGVGDFALSRNGTLVYAAGGENSAKRRLVWVDRDGKKASVVDEVAAFSTATMPEGGKLFAQAGQANDAIYSYDLGSGAKSQLTKGWDSVVPSWSADDGRMIFMSDRDGAYLRLYSMRPVAGAEADMLFDRNIFSIDDRARHGTFAVEVFDRSTNSDVWLLSLATRKGAPLLAGKDSEKLPALSPSGRLLAYVSDRTTPAEVFVVRIERPGDPVQVSSGGGSLPRWGATDAELLHPDGARILRVQVSEGPAGVVLKPPEALPFDVSQYLPVSGYSIPFFNITPDGSRFIMIEQLPGTAPPSALHLVTHWTTELQRKVGGQ